MSTTSIQSITCDQLNEEISEEITFSGFIPGCLSTLCAIQSEYYARQWGFSHPYESVISAGVSEFLTRYDEEKDYIRLVLLNNKVVGGIAIDHRNGQVAQLRLFIVPEQLHGTGIGKKLFLEAMAFVQASNITQVYLTTFHGLEKARYLYESVGFTLTQEIVASTWGKKVTEQRFDWLADNPMAQ